MMLLGLASAGKVVEILFCHVVFAMAVTSYAFTKTRRAGVPCSLICPRSAEFRDLRLRLARPLQSWSAGDAVLLKDSSSLRRWVTTLRSVDDSRMSVLRCSRAVQQVNCHDHFASAESLACYS